MNGLFGVLDPDDCDVAVEQAASQNLIDAKRVVIRGQSSGNVMRRNHFNRLFALTCLF